MRLNNQILGNLRENKEDWYYLCNDAEQALFKVKNECKDERAIKSIERMILELNSIRMEQYNALTEYALVEDEEIYSNLDLDNMVDALRTNFKGITNKDYIKKSLRFHYNNGFISEDEYNELYKEFVSNKNTVVKNYEDLPYGDFKANNTIGTLNNGRSFAIFDDNDVYIVNSSYEELKKAIYSDVDSFSEFMDKNSERADDKLETQILIDTKRLSPEALDESLDSYSEVPKITVSIYQIKDVANTDYAFRGYDEVADKIDLADYDKVATIDLPDNDDILETVFMYGNTDKSKFNEIKPMRSISVSDIIDYDDTMYYVDSFGFKEL